MNYRGHIVDIINRGTKEGDYRHCQLAVDGILTIPFDVHESDFLSFPNDALRNEFLARQGISLLEDYGDARYPQPIYTATSTLDRLPH